MEYKKIEKLGEDSSEKFPEVEKNSGESGGAGVLPLIQAALCALLLLALVFLKLTDGENYQRVTDWYRTEASRSVELPHWERREGSAEARTEEAVSEMLRELERDAPQPA